MHVNSKDVLAWVGSSSQNLDPSHPTGSGHERIPRLAKSRQLERDRTNYLEHLQGRQEATTSTESDACAQSRHEEILDPCPGLQILLVLSSAS